MKKKIALILVLVLTIATITVLFGTSHAATEGNYTYTVSNGEAKITKVSSSASGIISVPATLGGSPVTTIGGSAFYGCSAITQITLPSSVKTIESSAFQGCTSLTSISLPKGLTALGYSAFSGCSALAAITIPAELTAIERTTFNNCTSLTGVTFASGSKLTKIGDRAFYGCKSLSSVTIPANVETIVSSSFYNCEKLVTLTFASGSKLASIGSMAFSGCTSLKAISIPANVTSIGQFAFQGCAQSVTSLTVAAGNTAYRVDGNSLIAIATNSLILGTAKSTVPSYVTSIADGAFQNCTSLTEITIPQTVTEIKQHAFNGCTALETVTFEDESALATIGNSAFRNCESLVAFDIPAGVARISDSMFYGCTSLVSVAVPDSVTTIAGYAFSGCTSLRSITIPVGATISTYGPFDNCTSLALVTVKNPDVAAALTSSTACGKLIANAATIVIPASITELGSYVKSNFTFADSFMQDGQRVTAYAKHTHAANADTWETRQNTQSCTACGVEKLFCSVHDLSEVGCTEAAICNTCGYQAPPVGHDMAAPTCKLPATCTRCGHTDGDVIPHFVYVETQEIRNTILLQNDTKYPFTCLDGVYYSTNKDNSSTSVFTIKALYDCTLVIEYSVSSEPNFDKLIIANNGVSLDVLWGIVTGKTMTVEMKKGDVLTVTYAKDHANLWGDDNVSFKIVSGDIAEVTVEKSMPADTLDATCEGAVVCDGCGDVIKAALGHDEIPHKAKAPTCTQSGHDFYMTCTRCDYTTYEEKPATGHDWNEWQQTTPPTVVVDGEETRVCKNDSSHKETRTIMSEGVLAQWTIGTLCARLVAAEGSEGMYILHVFGTGAMESFTAGNAPWQAYMNTLKEVILYEGVTSVGDNAFRSAQALEAVIIPETLTSIGAHAFRDCSSLSAVSTLENITLVGNYAFLSCTALRALTFGEGATLANVEDYSFFNCEALTLIVVKNAELAERITAADALGDLTANAVTISFAEEVTAASDYVKTAYTSCDTLVSEGETYTVYSKHPHAGDAHTWEKTTSGKSCSLCGVTKDTDEPDCALGDINGDGTINILDVTACVSAASGVTLDPARFPGNADINGDGTVNVLDVTLIVSLASGK